MESKDKTTEDYAKDFVKSIENMSDKRIELALKDRDVQFQEAIKNTEETAKKIAQETIKEEVNLVKKDMFVIFGIFASFITFIAGEINILKTIDTIYDKIGFSFLFVSFILGFLFGIMFLLDSDVIKNKYQKMSIVFSLFFFIGLAFMVIPYLIIKI